MKNFLKKIFTIQNKKYIYVCFLILAKYAVLFTILHISFTLFLPYKVVLAPMHALLLSFGFLSLYLVDLKLHWLNK